MLALIFTLLAGVSISIASITSCDAESGLCCFESFAFFEAFFIVISFTMIMICFNFVTVQPRFKFTAVIQNFPATASEKDGALSAHSHIRKMARRSAKDLCYFFRRQQPPFQLFSTPFRMALGAHSTFISLVYTRLCVGYEYRG